MKATRPEDLSLIGFMMSMEVLRSRRDREPVFDPADFSPSGTDAPDTLRLVAFSATGNPVRMVLDKLPGFCSVVGGKKEFNLTLRDTLRLQLTVDKTKLPNWGLWQDTLYITSHENTPKQVKVPIRGSYTPLKAEPAQLVKVQMLRAEQGSLRLPKHLEPGESLRVAFRVENLTRDTVRFVPEPVLWMQASSKNVGTIEDESEAFTFRSILEEGQDYYTAASVAAGTWGSDKMANKLRELSKKLMDLMKGATLAPRSSDTLYFELSRDSLAAGSQSYVFSYRAVGPDFQVISGQKTVPKNTRLNLKCKQEDSLVFRMEIDAQYLECTRKSEPQGNWSVLTDWANGPAQDSIEFKLFNLRPETVTVRQVYLITDSSLHLRTPVRLEPYGSLRLRIPYTPSLLCSKVRLEPVAGGYDEDSFYPGMASYYGLVLFTEQRQGHAVADTVWGDAKSLAQANGICLEGSRIEVSYSYAYTHFTQLDSSLQSWVSLRYSKSGNRVTARNLTQEPVMLICDGQQLLNEEFYKPVILQPGQSRLLYLSNPYQHYLYVTPARNVDLSRGKLSGKLQRYYISKNRIERPRNNIHGFYED